MNAKLKVCTNRCLLLTAAVLSLGIAQGIFSYSILAQDVQNYSILNRESIMSSTRYDRIQNESIWSYGRNICGLRTEAPIRVSDAKAFGGYASGDFKEPSDASQLWRAGAEARTRTDLDAFSMVGSFSFSQKQGNDMCGSMFVHPGYYPLDILEFTPGRKTLQTYSFSGGIAVPLNDRWIVGGKMDFESDNYAKRKDIRHTNYRLDMTVSPSVLLRLDGGLNLGLSGILRKTSESIQAEQIGTATASSYYAFLDKGLKYGSYQVWDGNGIHLKDTGVDRFAVKELSYGASLQIEKKLSGMNLYADIEYLLTKGEQGEKSYNYYRFPGSELNASVACVRAAEQHTDVFRTNISYKRQENNEYVIDKVTSGGVTTPVTYGSNKIFERRSLNVAPEYIVHGRGSFGWLREARASVGWTKNEEQSSLVYPYVGTLSGNVFNADASASFKVSRFTFGCGLSWLSGSAAKSESGSESEVTVSAPYNLTDWWNLQNEWEYSSRVAGAVSVRYDMLVTRLSALYVEAKASVLKGLDVNFAEGSSRMEGLLSIGYEF